MKTSLPFRPVARASEVRRFDDETVVLLPAKTPMRRLSATERATLAPEWDEGAPFSAALTIPVEAAGRIILRAHVSGASALRGSALAFELQDLFYPGVRPRYPWRGMELLRLVDATADQHGVRVYVGTDHGPMRLTDRLGELGWSA